MAYTTPTLAQAKTALAARLNDPSNVHWLSAELGVYISEALRTWNCWTSHWRDRGTFSTDITATFYDLSTQLPTLRGRTVTNWNLVTDIQYALLEPAAAGGTWTGTSQFDLTIINAAMQRRRDQFLRDTGSILTNAVTAYNPPPSNGRIALAEEVLIVRRAAWMPTATNLLRPLLRTDEWAATHFAPAWPQSTKPPSAYSVSAVPPITLQLMPTTTANGSLDLVSLNKGAFLDPATETILGISDDFAWGVKFGTLADLLNGDGLALDPQRAAYCEARYQECVNLAKRAPVILDARIDNVTVRVSSLADADSYSPLWQLVAGKPLSLLLAGQNLVATNPRAGAGPYTVLLDVVTNAPIPANDFAVLDLGQDIYDSILDYAQHLAVSKDGPGELQTSMALLNRAQAAAGVEVTVQQASQPSRVPLLRQQAQDDEAVARELPAVSVA